jgi:hypothetical protein
MLGDETMDAIRSRDDDPADILIMWMWSVGCLGWGLWKRVAYLSITLALDCDFFCEHVFVFVLLLGWILFFWSTIPPAIHRWLGIYLLSWFGIRYSKPAINLSIYSFLLFCS